MKIDLLVFNSIDVGLSIFYIFISVFSLLYLYSKGKWLSLVASFVICTFIISFSMLYYGGVFNWYVGGYNNIGFSLISLLIVGLFSTSIYKKMDSITWWGEWFSDSHTFIYKNNFWSCCYWFSTSAFSREEV
jgi:hypothetical protein